MRTPVHVLAERLGRPQRIGVFGRRGVGKTTLLAMLYREAVAGRLPGLRLAAADARTATYLADKVVQLEQREILPGTLGETELRFRLYHQGAQIDLLVMDYQGEHVELGREEPIRAFLRECDAVWLCLEAPAASDAARRWQAELEVEQAVEDYLAKARAEEPHRPMALVVTKGDLLQETGDADAVRKLVAERFGMTRHTLESHCPWHDIFPISSLGEGNSLTPDGLDAPLAWLARTLHEQDRARLDRLWALNTNLGLLGKATDAYVRRYPECPHRSRFERRLKEARQRRRRNWAVAAVATLAVLALGGWGYDFVGAATTRQAVAQVDDPVEEHTLWQRYQERHPTRYFFTPTSAEEAETRVVELDEILHEQEREQRLAEVRRRAADPEIDPRELVAEFRRFFDDFPEYEPDEAIRRLYDRARASRDRKVKQETDIAQQKRDQEALADYLALEKAERAEDLAVLIERCDRFLKMHPNTKYDANVTQRRTAYLRRLDDRTFEAARDYSKRYPRNFVTRKTRYQTYLNRYPDGAHASAARSAMREIAADWDRNDYKALRDLYVDSPTYVKQIRVKARAYLNTHRQGKWGKSVKSLEAWCDKVLEKNEYTVTLKSGSFDKKVAHLVSRGAYLSVVIEVDGVRHGPSPIVKRSYEPEWDYTFPRPIKWKFGDSVRVIVIDNYYWKRTVSDDTHDSDPLAIRKLSGETDVTYGTLTFRSTFSMPKLPRVQ